MTPTQEAPPHRDAATVIVLRPAQQAFETLLLKRSAGSGFLSGIHVFPGGKVEERDRAAAQNEKLNFSQLNAALVQALGCASEEEAKVFYITALRETYEEASIALRTNALIPCARWITPVVETKRFDARFFLATLPEGQNVTVDGGEVDHLDWITPAQALEAVKSGAIRLTPPTLMMLDWLTRFDNIDAAQKYFSHTIPVTIQPEITATDDGWFLSFPGDAKHSVPERKLPGPTRLVMDDQKRWMPVETTDSQKA